MTKRGRTNGALDAINSQRKARADLVALRQREADVLTGLKTEQAIRWLILAMVLCCDPLAIALTAAASARRSPDYSVAL
jgi:hypothetical protein